EVGEAPGQDVPQLHRRQPLRPDVVDEGQRDHAVRTNRDVPAEVLVLPDRDVEQVIRTDPEVPALQGLALLRLRLPPILPARRRAPRAPSLPPAGSCGRSSREKASRTAASPPAVRR